MGSIDMFELEYCAHPYVSFKQNTYVYRIKKINEHDNKKNTICSRSNYVLIFENISMYIMQVNN